MKGHALRITIFLFSFIYIISCSNDDNKSKFSAYADFETSKYVSFIWSTDFYGIVPDLVVRISQKDDVKIYYDQKYGLQEIKEKLNSDGANLENIKFEKSNNIPNSNWIRDYGPTYIVNRNKKEIIDFKHFGKTLKFNTEISEISEIPVKTSNLNSSGGAREVNGKGCLILCESHELDVNKPKSKKEIEDEYIDLFNLKKVIWLKQGIPQDDNPLTGPLYENIYPNGVNGHVDEFCRFVNPNTIFISSISEEEAKKHPIMAEAKNRKPGSAD